MSSRRWFVQAIWLPFVSARQNSTEIAGWVNDPDGRGTFTILSSCILTLSLCVYTSIHLNVRSYKQTELRAWVETTKWVFFGILAPELMVYVAWRQYMSARALDRVVKGLKTRAAQETLGSRDEVRVNRQRSWSSTITWQQGKQADTSDTGYSLENPWSRLHSFYANMGGFVFDLDQTSSHGDGAFTTKVQRLTLTP